MRVNRTYSIPFETINELNRTISAKYRSKFVSKAINNRLKAQDQFSLRDIDTRRLMAALQTREDCPKHIRIVLWDQLQGEQQ